MSMFLKCYLCEKVIATYEEYRCMDCAGIYHRDCLREHCAKSGDEKDRVIWHHKVAREALEESFIRLVDERDEEIKKLKAEIEKLKDYKFMYEALLH